jgi:hypothetical protein
MHESLRACVCVLGDETDLAPCAVSELTLCLEDCRLG